MTYRISAILRQAHPLFCGETPHQQQLGVFNKIEMLCYSLHLRLKQKL